MMKKLMKGTQHHLFQSSQAKLRYPTCTSFPVPVPPTRVTSATRKGSRRVDAVYVQKHPMMRCLTSDECQKHVHSQSQCGCTDQNLKLIGTKVRGATASLDFPSSRK